MSSAANDFRVIEYKSLNFEKMEFFTLFFVTFIFFTLRSQNQKKRDGGFHKTAQPTVGPARFIFIIIYSIRLIVDPIHII